jgi:hypothetical protein
MAGTSTKKMRKEDVSNVEYTVPALDRNLFLPGVPYPFNLKRRMDHRFQQMHRDEE